MVRTTIKKYKMVIGLRFEMEEEMQSEERDLGR